MIRNLIVRARAAAKSPTAGMALAGLFLSLGMDMFVRGVKEMQAELLAMQEQVRAMQTAPAEDYPAQEDLDPLGRGE